MQPLPTHLFKKALWELGLINAGMIVPASTVYVPMLLDTSREVNVHCPVVSEDVVVNHATKAPHTLVSIVLSPRSDSWMGRYWDDFPAEACMLRHSCTSFAALDVEVDPVTLSDTA